MPVQTLTQVDPTQFFNLPATNGTGTQRLDTKVSGVAISNDFSGRLNVTTAEGDRITLSADLETDFRAVNYKCQAAGDGKTVDVEAKYAEFSLKEEFGVTVEGDLNEQEVKDLAKLFRKVANIFKKYLSGRCFFSIVDLNWETEYGPGMVVLIFSLPSNDMRNFRVEFFPSTSDATCASFSGFFKTE